MLAQWWASVADGGPRPANTTHLYNIYIRLAQRLQRWSYIVQMLCLCFVSTEISYYDKHPVWLSFYNPTITKTCIALHRIVCYAVLILSGGYKQGGEGVKPPIAKILLIGSRYEQVTHRGTDSVQYALDCKRKPLKIKKHVSGHAIMCGCERWMLTIFQ